MSDAVMRYAYFEPGIELGVTPSDADASYHQGACDDDVARLRKSPYIAEQLTKIAPEQAIAALRHYGAWDDVELARDHNANLERLLWLACADVVDNPQ